MAPAERLHQTGCMDGVGLHGWRNGWPRKACIPGTGTVQCTVLFSTGKCTGSSGGGVGTSVSSRTVIFRGALLNAGDSGVRTLGTGFTMMFTTAGHTRYTARHHSVGSGCGHLGSGRVQTPSEGEIHRLWLRYNAAEWWGFGGGGQQPQGHSRRAREPAVNADCSQHESSRASPNRIPTRIWSSPSLPDLELSKPPRFGAQGVPSIRTVEMNAEDLPVGRLLSIWSAQCGACVRAGAVKRSVPALWELRWELTWSRPL